MFSYKLLRKYVRGSRLFEYNTIQYLFEEFRQDKRYKNAYLSIQAINSELKKLKKVKNISLKSKKVISKKINRYKKILRGQVVLLLNRFLISNRSNFKKNKQFSRLIYAELMLGKVEELRKKMKYKTVNYKGLLLVVWSLWIW